jgi:hypothetical protein
MSWQDDTRNLLRQLSGDIGPVCEYNDSRLDELILYAAKIVITETFLTDTYSVTLNTGTISPDPSTDDWFISLLVLKSWEILANNEYRIASNKALSIRDGPSAVDGRAVADNKKEIAKKAREQYETALMSYNAGTYNAGAAILSPFRVEDSGGSDSFFS